MSVSGAVVEYPTASSPRAWAAGAPLLLLAAVLGLEATPEGSLKADPALPDGMNSVALDGIRHRGSRYALRVDRGAWKLRRL